MGSGNPQAVIWKKSLYRQELKTPFKKFKNQGLLHNITETLGSINYFKTMEYYECIFNKVSENILFEYLLSARIWQGITCAVRSKKSTLFLRNIFEATCTSEFYLRIFCCFNNDDCERSSILTIVCKNTVSEIWIDCLDSVELNANLIS